MNPSRRQFLGAAAAVLGTGAWAANPVADAFASAQPFYGVVLLARRGQPVYAQAFGMADIEGRRALQTTTAFCVASISKWLTATVVLKLQEQGKLSLDATIGQLLPWYRGNGADQVRLRHLLSNTSGIPNQFKPAQQQQPLSTREAIERYAMGDLGFAPGSRFDYVSTNWYIVTGIIEAVTGQPYQQAMRALLLDPLGLASTSAEPDLAALAYAAIAPPVRKLAAHQHFMVASGGYYSSASDLLRAARGIYNEGFLSPASLQALTRIEVPAEDYALGGRVKTLLADGAPQRYAWETGRTAGYRSVLGHRLDGEHTVIILNNTDLSQKALDEFAYRLLGAAPAA